MTASERGFRIYIALAIAGTAAILAGTTWLGVFVYDHLQWVP